MMEEKQLTLSQLNTRIKNVVMEGFPASVWVVAEILELNLNRSGHCYLELIEKTEKDEHIVARIRGTIWAFQYRMLRPYFETITGTTLKPGIRILFKCTVEFHEQYGISLNITDIDPNYTMGDLARKKQEVIRKLKADGVFDMNRETLLPEVPQRIAIISSETAAGYGDFMNTLIGNNYGYSFRTKLFPAIMQGNGAEASVILALEQIYDSLDDFDCVVLIRGGGSQADLDCFNSYEIAANIAQFPIPVLTGIGHERDETVADLVANTRLKTPTAVAEFLIDQLAAFDAHLNQLEDHFGILVRQVIQEKKQQIREYSSSLSHLVKRTLQSETIELNHLDQILKKTVSGVKEKAGSNLSGIKDRLRRATKNVITGEIKAGDRYMEKLRYAVIHSLAAEKNRLQMFEKQVQLTDPVNTLKRGFTITCSGDKIITDLSTVAPGDQLTTRFRDGSLNSIVKKITKRSK